MTKKYKTKIVSKELVVILQRGLGLGLQEALEWDLSNSQLVTSPFKLMDTSFKMSHNFWLCVTQSQIL